MVIPFQITQTLQNYASTAGVFSPDGQVFIVGCQDQTIKIKNVQTGIDVQILEGLTREAVVLAISPDGSILCAGDGNHGITIWDLPTGKIIHYFPNAHSNVITALVISPNGKTLISGSWDWSIKIWNLTSGKITHRLDHKCAVYGLAIAPDGEKFSSAGNTDEIKVWSLKTGMVLQTLKGHLSIVGALAISDNGKFLASGSKIGMLLRTFDEVALKTGQYRSIKIWDIKTGQELNSLTGHNDDICALAISADGKILVSSSEDRTIKVWDLDHGQVQHTLTGHSHWVKVVALSPDQPTLASLGYGTLKFWNLSTGQLLSSYTGHSDSVIRLTPSPDGQVFASGSRDRNIKIWNLQTCQEICTLVGKLDRQLSFIVTSDEEIVSWVPGEAGDAPIVRSQPGHSDSVFCMAFNPANSQQLISGSVDKTIKIWDLTLQRVTHTLIGHEDIVFALAVHSQGQTLMSGGKDETLKLWNLQTGELIRTVAAEYWVRNILVGAETDTFICGGKQAAIQIRHWETGEIIRQIGTESDGNLSLDISSDQQFLLSCGTGGIIRVWHLETGELIRRIQSSSGYCGAISPDNNLIAVGSDDNTISLFSMKTGEELQTLTGHKKWGVKSLFFSTDGYSIISGGGDGMIKVWKTL